MSAVLEGMSNLGLARSFFFIVGGAVRLECTAVCRASRAKFEGLKGARSVFRRVRSLVSDSRLSGKVCDCCSVSGGMVRRVSCGPRLF